MHIPPDERHKADFQAWLDAGVDSPGAERRLQKLRARQNRYAAEYSARRSARPIQGYAPHSYWADAHALVPVNSFQGSPNQPYGGLHKD